MQAFNQSNSMARRLRWIALAALFFAVSCTFFGLGGTPTPGPEAVPTVDLSSLPPTTPRLVAQRPFPGEELALDGSIELYFDQPMDRASVEQRLRISPDIPVTLAWIDDSTLQITPQAGALDRDQTLEITLDPGVASSEGLSNPETLVVEVQTVGYLEVGEVFPVSDSVDIDTSSVITVFFNRPVVPLTVGVAASDLPQPLSFNPPVEGTGEWLNTSIYAFTPAEALTGGQQYTVQVAAGLEDQTGGVLQDVFSWSFVTETPQIFEVSPANGDFNVVLDRDVLVTFNQPMDRASTEGAFSLVDQNNQAVAGSFNWVNDDSAFYFEPRGRLPIGATLTASVGDAARSANGQGALTNPSSWVFSTVLPPGVLRSNPTAGATNVPVWQGFTFFFASPMDEDSLDGKLQISPPLANEPISYYNDYDFSWQINGAFEPSTQYSVTLLPGAQDPYGNRINEPLTVSYSTGPYEPSVSVAAPGPYGFYDASRPSEVFVEYMNVSRIEVALYPMTLDEFSRALREGSYSPGQAAPLRELTVQPSAGLNQWGYERIALDPAGGSLPEGIYSLLIDVPEINGQVQHYMFVSSANLTLKNSFEESLVWVTDLASGEPIAGATVQIFSYELNPLGQGTTAADGVARIDIPLDEGLWDTQFALWEGGDRFGIAFSNLTYDLDPWAFGYAGNFDWQDYSIYLYSDRPIYRPGQTVHFKGVVRSRSGAAYNIPAGLNLPVEIYNDAGEVVLSTSFTLSEFGSFVGSVDLPEDGGTGFYTVNVLAGDEAAYLGFQVAEYRPPEISVSVSAARPNLIAGEEIEVQVQADFFSGGGVPEAPVTWYVFSAPYYFDGYKGAGRYSFVDYEEEGIFFGEDFYPGFGELIADGTASTDAQGGFTLNLPGSTVEAGGSRRLTIEATVEATAGQPVSSRSEVIVHQGQVYPGVRTDRYVGEAGQESPISLIAVDTEGKTLANQSLSVQIFSRVWAVVEEEDEFGRTAEVWRPQDTPISAPVSVQTDATGRATLSFTPQEGGTYRIVATATDSRGRQNSAATYFWVWGDQGYISWRGDNSNRVELIADKTEYVPGDSAEILIASPFGERPVQALITIERAGILSHVVVPLQGSSYVYRLPITGDLAPNVYVSAVLMAGTDANNPLPEFRMGMVEIVVSPSEQTLDVSITADPPQAGPRDTVTFTVAAADSNGQPVDAEVSLALVDLAVLSLASPNSSNIVDAFYSRQPLGVRSTVPLALLVDRVTQELLDEGKGGGGGGGEGFFEIRSEFEDTALWRGQVRTGPGGSTSIEVTLPDNLTTWRMDARAVTPDTLVGSATLDLLATKPLLIRPLTPRYFVAGDEATLRAGINNNTNSPLEVTVTLQATGVSIQGEATQDFTVPANGVIEVAWPVRVDGAGDWADLVFSVNAENGLSDSARPRVGDPENGQQVPILRYAAPEISGTAGDLSTAGERLEGISLPAIYNIEQATVDVRIDPSLAAATLQALDYLEHFEHECTEQTVSRFLPNALTLRALRSFGLENPELEANLSEQVQIGLQRLLSRQDVSGGWGWFPASQPDPLVTAYVLQGLVAAEEAGFSVDAATKEMAISYLNNALPTVDPLGDPSLLNRQAYLLYVLGEAGQPNAARITQLYDARGSMDHYAWALLAMAMHRVDAADPRLATLESGLVNNAVISASGVHWEEQRDADTFNWNTDTRSTAIILAAFSQIWPQSELAPGTVRWLMIAREGDAWSTTQESAWALIGLTDWMLASGELAADYDWALTLNGQPLQSGQASGSDLGGSAETQIPFASLVTPGVNRLGVSRGEGPGQLYYTAHLNAYLPVAQIEPLSRGLILARRYFNEEGEVVTEARVGETLSVEISIIAPHDLYYLVVEDHYPAGADPVDRSLDIESATSAYPTLAPADLFDEGWGWGWWWFSDTDLRDEKAVLYADNLPAGSYQYSYEIRLGTVGRFQVIPTYGYQFYMPDVYGRGEGTTFTVLP